MRQRVGNTRRTSLCSAVLLSRHGNGGRVRAVGVERGGDGDRTVALPEGMEVVRRVLEETKDYAKGMELCDRLCNVFGDVGMEGAVEARWWLSRRWRGSGGANCGSCWNRQGMSESVSMDCSDWLVSWKQKRSDHTLQQRETHLFRNNSR